MPTELTSFTPEVAEKLKTYVYRLIDPRNGETFYVGKGRETGSSRTSVSRWKTTTPATSCGESATSTSPASRSRT